MHRPETAFKINAPRQNQPRFQTPRERFLAAARSLPVDRTPVWLMRQAGRCLPEYRSLKKKFSFTEIVQTPELAAQVTLQPIDRFGFDAAILFSDILVVPEAMGLPYRFKEGVGIEMERSIRSAEDIRRLDPHRVAEHLHYVAEALALIKPMLKGHALIGFAGAPWTLASFMVDGPSERGSSSLKKLFQTERPLFEELMSKLAEAVTEYLQLQTDAGVDALQIFDSLGGRLATSDYAEASGRWIQQITTALKGRVPVILFAKGVNGCWGYLSSLGVDVLSLDSTQSAAAVRAILPGAVGVQGNLAPSLLATTPQAVTRETLRILRDVAGAPGHIFNLGHGVPPEANLECIEALVETVRNFS